MLAVSFALATALAKGTVQLTLVNATGRPWPHHDVWLTATNSTKTIRPFGDLWVVPQGDDTWHGTTDERGRVNIPGVPTGKPLMVVCRFGPRFDEYVQKGGDSMSSADVMKFEGAVYANRPARVVLSNDYAVMGRVVDSAGHPLVGAKVVLADTGFGHMGGYPGTDLAETTTAPDGTYKLDRLPNCAFIVSVVAPEFAAVEGKVEQQPWDLLYVVNQGGVSGLGVSLRRATTRCDFRVTQTAEVTVNVTGTLAEVKDWTIWLRRLGSRDFFSDYTGHVLGKERSTTWHVLPGTYDIVFDKDDLWAKGDRFQVKSGDKTTLQVKMSDALKTKKRK